MNDRRVSNERFQIVVALEAQEAANPTRGRSMLVIYVQHAVGRPSVRSVVLLFEFGLGDAAYGAATALRFVQSRKRRLAQPVFLQSFLRSHFHLRSRKPSPVVRP